MKLAVALSLAGLGILCSGCALVQDARRNLCVSVCSPFEAHREQARNRRWAEAAWQQLACSEHFCKKSDDYARGFKDGYVEYVFRGGDGEPPLVAPLRYRHMRYQTADGYAAIEDWFAGYRHGAALARETGARRWVTGPSSLPGELLAQGPPDMPTFAPALPIYESRNGTPMTPPQFLPL
ncbi:MAG: hypothetical protein HYR84_03910, partial [Planctomycetes bacterium]|nr:hypothetical protein [Planctomycetota bacterium]